MESEGEGKTRKKKGKGNLENMRTMPLKKSLDLHVMSMYTRTPNSLSETDQKLPNGIPDKNETKTANENRRATAALPWLLTLVGWAAQPVHIVVVSTRNSPSETRSPAAESGFDWTPCDIVASDSRRMTTLQTSSSAFVQLWFATLQIGLNHSFITLSTGIAAICHRYLIGKVCYMLSP